MRRGTLTRTPAAIATRCPFFLKPSRAAAKVASDPANVRANLELGALLDVHGEAVELDREAGVLRRRWVRPVRFDFDSPDVVPYLLRTGDVEGWLAGGETLQEHPAIRESAVPLP
jgi:hypothetical protein